VFLHSVSPTNPGCKPFSGGNRDQNIPHRPFYPAGSAGYITLALRKLHDFGECSLGSGKYLGHPCWSRAARSLLIENGDKLKGIQKSLAHEHVVPVQLIVQELLALPKQSKIEQYEEVIRNLSLVAIITRDEESKYLRPVKLADAPNERWFEKDPWWRYRQAGILKDILNETGKRIQIKA
jgi:hypothetical protein